MSKASGPTTHLSLLARLRTDPNDQAAWAAFVDRYGPQLYAWCKDWKLQEADAQDIAQNVLIKLGRALPRFVYDPGRSFRGWLRTLTHHAWSDFIAEQQAGVRGSADTQVLELLQTLPARDDLTTRLQAAFDQELLERAMDLVRGRVKPATWEAFKLTAVDGLTAAEAGERLGMRVGTVFQARSSVQRTLKETLAELNPEESE